MFRSLLSPATLTLLTFITSSSVTPFVLAQSFRPQPHYDTCSAYTEGQGLYVIGDSMTENFMLDLSVSWNTSDPVFREITNGPRVDDRGACAMTNNGEDLFVLTKGTGYVYNVKSGSWRVLHNENFATTGSGRAAAAADPETGFIYLINNGMTFAGEKVMLSLDLKTDTVNTTKLYTYPKVRFELIQRTTWSAYLKSIITMRPISDTQMFTPSNMGAADYGWDILTLVKDREVYFPTYSNCAAAAYNGTKLVYIGAADTTGFRVYIMDLVKRTWTRGSTAPKIDMSACAISGDQFIVWGGQTNWKPTNKTYVYNMKTEKWVSRYIAPPPRPTTTTPASQTPIQPITNAPESGNASSNDMKPVTIIVIGTLLVVILGLIFIYRRRTRQFNSGGQGTGSDGSSTDSLDVKVGDSKTSVKELFVGSSRRRDPSDPGTDSTDHLGRRKWYMNGLLGRIHQGPFGARPLSEHPHATVEDPTTKRNVQGGALEVPILSQHPHTVIEEMSILVYNHKTMLGPIGRYGDKEELEDE